MVGNFEIMGSWWLPERDTIKIPGVLKFEADTEIELKLMGTFYESPEQFYSSEQPQYFDIILGEANGNKLTLFRSQEKTKDGGSVGVLTYMLSSFHCEYILKGIHFLRVNDVKFAQ